MYVYRFTTYLELLFAALPNIPLLWPCFLISVTEHHYVNYELMPHIHVRSINAGWWKPTSWSYYPCLNLTRLTGAHSFLQTGNYRLSWEMEWCEMEWCGAGWYWPPPEPHRFNQTSRNVNSDHWNTSCHPKTWQIIPMFSTDCCIMVRNRKTRHVCDPFTGIYINYEP